MMERIKKIQTGEGGMETLTVAILIFVVLIIAVALFAFRDSVAGFIKAGTGKVDTMKTNLNSQLTDSKLGGTP